MDNQNIDNPASPATEGVRAKITFLTTFLKKNRIGRVKMVLTRKKKLLTGKSQKLLKLALII